MNNELTSEQKDLLIRFSDNDASDTECMITYLLELYNLRSLLSEEFSNVLVKELINNYEYILNNFEEVVTKQTYSVDRLEFVKKQQV